MIKVDGLPILTSIRVMLLYSSGIKLFSLKFCNFSLISVFSLSSSHAQHIQDMVFSFFEIVWNMKPMTFQKIISINFLADGIVFVFFFLFRSHFGFNGIMRNPSLINRCQNLLLFLLNVLLFDQKLISNKHFLSKF